MNFLKKISDGRTDLIIDHIENGGDHSDTDTYGTSLIKIAAYYGDVSAIKYLLSKGASMEELGANYDLNGAAFHGHWQLCQYLLEKGADPNLANPDNGETPLHAALCKANDRNTVSVVKLLLHYKANPNAKTIYGAETGGFMRDAKTYGETPLHRAAAFGNIDILQMLLDAGADKAQLDDTGSSPLTWASWHLRPGKVLALLTYGPHNLNPLHIERIQGDHGFGFGASRMTGLSGKLHFSTPLRSARNEKDE